MGRARPAHSDSDCGCTGARIRYVAGVGRHRRGRKAHIDSRAGDRATRLCQCQSRAEARATAGRYLISRRRGNRNVCRQVDAGYAEGFVGSRVNAQAAICERDWAVRHDNCGRGHGGCLTAGKGR